MNIARGLESQAAATLATQYNHLLDRIQHLYFLLERNWQNVLSVLLCEALDYICYFKKWGFVLCSLTIYSWLQTPFYLQPASGPPLTVCTRRLLCHWRHKLVLLLLLLSAFLLIWWLLATAAAGGQHWHSRGSSCAKRGSQQVSAMLEEWSRRGTFILMGDAVSTSNRKNIRGFCGCLACAFLQVACNWRQKGTQARLHSLRNFKRAKPTSI